MFDPHLYCFFSLLPELMEEFTNILFQISRSSPLQSASNSLICELSFFCFSLFDYHVIHLLMRLCFTHSWGKVELSCLICYWIGVQDGLCWEIMHHHSNGIPPPHDGDFQGECLKVVFLVLMTRLCVQIKLLVGGHHQLLRDNVSRHSCRKYTSLLDITNTKSLKIF